jgi:hypothetical protein
MPAPRLPQRELQAMVNDFQREERLTEGPPWSLTVDTATAYACSVDWPGGLVTVTTVAACSPTRDYVGVLHMLRFAEARGWLMAGRVLVRILDADALRSYALQGAPAATPVSAFINVTQVLGVLGVAAQYADEGVGPLIAREREHLAALDPRRVA